MDGTSQQDSECAACNVMASELQRQTSGTPIHSEMQRMEVLESLCGRLDDYIGSAADGKAKFAKPKIGQDGKPVLDLNALGSKATLDLSDIGSLMNNFQHVGDQFTGSARKTKTDELKSFCSQLIEAHEDELSDLLISGSDSLHDAMCVQTAARCSMADVQAHVEDEAKAAAEAASKKPSASKTSSAPKKASASKKKPAKKKKKKDGKGKEEL